MWRVNAWLVIGVLSVATPPQSCERQGTPAGPPQLLVGQNVSRVITSRDRPCSGSSAPCLVFQVPADKGGVLRATLVWATKTNGLRLELWNGNDGDGTCCHSGESVSVPVTPGDNPEIHVVLTESQGKGARQTFELRTSIQEPQE
jgi:hypothetical protein